MMVENKQDIKWKEEKMKKINKRGWIRIVEAFLAVLIILSAFLFFASKQTTINDPSADIYDREKQILEIISKNDDLRNKVIVGNETTINNEISRLVPTNWKYNARICGIDDICSYQGDYMNKEIYSSEIIITSTLTEYNPKKLRLFVWF